MNNIRAIDKLNATELASGLAGTSASWHAQYRDSAFIYAGGLPLTLTEGDLLCIFSQYGEILHVHLARDRESGKSKGFAWIKYSDQRSTDMAVDNLNGVKVLDRIIRVDHAAQFKRPELKDEGDGGEEARRRRDIEDLVGGNVAPEIWNKSLKEMEAVVARRFGGGPDRDEEDKKAKKKHKKHKKREDRGDGESGGDESDVSDTGLDPEDPMYKYLKEAKRELKREKRAKRKARKEAKAAARAKEEPQQLHSLDHHGPSRTRHSRSRSPQSRTDRESERGRGRDEYRSARREDDQESRGQRRHREHDRDEDRYRSSEYDWRERERRRSDGRREREHDRYDRDRRW